MKAIQLIKGDIYYGRVNIADREQFTPYYFLDKKGLRDS